MDHALIANQIAMTTMARTMAAHIAGVTRFEVPLRGESLAARLNSLSIRGDPRRSQRRSRHAILSKHRQDLVPKRRTFAVAIVLRSRRLRRADGIGCRKAADQTGLQFRVNVAVGQSGFAGVGGMPVMRRRVEFLSHVE